VNVHVGFPLFTLPRFLQSGFFCGVTRTTNLFGIFSFVLCPALPPGGIGKKQSRLYFYKTADNLFIFDDTARANLRKWADAHTFADPATLEVRILDDTFVIDGTIRNGGKGTDNTNLPHRNPARYKGALKYHGVAADCHIGADEHTVGLRDVDAGIIKLFENSLPRNKI
jgi:hypothetical protein